MSHVPGDEPPESSSDHGNAMRRALVEEVMRVAEADGGLFYTIDASATAPRALSNLVALGAATPAADRIDEIFARHPTAVPDPRQAREGETTGFLDATTVFGSWERFVERPFTQTLRSVAGVADQIRMLAFQGDRYLGWIGAFRRWDAPRFGARERHRLAGMVPHVVTTLASADALESEGLPDAPAYVVVRPDGSVEQASDGGHTWLARAAFRAALAGVVRSTDQRDDGAMPASPCPIWRARARLTRLEGADGVRYLACLEPFETVRRPPLARLSPTQRRVAMLVADGLRRKEIAELLALGQETVRSHVREIYRRLEVADRFELQRLLQADAGR